MKMQKLMVTTMAALATAAAFAQIDHSQLVNLPGGGTGAIAGADVSQLTTGEGTFGYGFQAGVRNTMADDFDVVSSPFLVTGISVFGYTTGATAPSITSVSWAITDFTSGPTKTLTTSAVTSQWWNPNPLGVYRTNVGDTFSNNRRIQLGQVTGLNILLNPGTFYLSVEAAGVNFTPPIPNTQAVYGKNALQSVGVAGAFAPVVNGTVGGADLAFIIHGQAVPEPATMAVLGLGAAALLRRRNKKA